MDIIRFLPINEYNAAVNSDSPTASNPFVTSNILTTALGSYLPLTGGIMTGDITMDSGTQIISGNGNGFLKLDYGGADRVRLANRDDVGNFGNITIRETNVVQLQSGNFNFGSGFSQTIYSDDRVDISLYSNPFVKWGRFGIQNNDSAEIGAFDFDSYPSYAGIRNVSADIGVSNVFLTGRDYNAKSSDGLYTNRIYMSKNNESFELAIEHQTITTLDKLATFQNASGIVALSGDWDSGETYVVSNDNTLRTINANGINGNNLRDLVCTLIRDLKESGILTI